jgi:hypothetical protein
LLGFERDEAVASAAKPAEPRVRIATHPTKRLVDDIETGNDLANILKPSVVGYIKQPEGLDIGLTKDCPLTSEIKEDVHSG